MLCFRFDFLNLHVVIRVKSETCLERAHFITGEVRREIEWCFFLRIWGFSLPLFTSIFISLLWWSWNVFRTWMCSSNSFLWQELCGSDRYWCRVRFVEYTDSVEARRFLFHIPPSSADNTGRVLPTKVFSSLFRIGINLISSTSYLGISLRFPADRMMLIDDLFWDGRFSSHFSWTGKRRRRTNVDRSRRY